MVSRYVGRTASDDSLDVDETAEARSRKGAG